MKAIEFENIGKQYRLGLVSTGTFSHDLNRWWTMNVLGKPDPNLKIGEANDRTHKGDSKYVWALKDINFSVEEGDVVGIIGKNGAGKSTLLKLLSRVTTPTTGIIRARGRIASLLEVGTGFHPEMTGRENIYMNGAIMGMTKAEISRKFDEIVDFSGCERYIDTPVKRYSSGMTVRLGFAIAAHLEPEVLVVDEVLAVGDAEFQEKAIGKMNDISRGKGRTVLFVSHNMASIRHLCSKGVVLKNGSLSFQGSTNEAIDYYLRSCLSGNENLSISEMPRRGHPSGRLHFNSLTYFSINDEPTTPHCGHPLKIRVGFDVKDNAVGSMVGISVEIRDLYGSPLLYFPSHLIGTKMSFTAGQHYITVVVKKLPLCAGTYRILLWADVQNECADFIDCEIRMMVEDDDFFGKGKQVPPHLKNKIVLCDYQWYVD